MWGDSSKVVGLKATSGICKQAGTFRQWHSSLAMTQHQYPFLTPLHPSRVSHVRFHLTILSESPPLSIAKKDVKCQRQMSNVNIKTPKPGPSLLAMWSHLLVTPILSCCYNPLDLSSKKILLFPHTHWTFTPTWPVTMLYALPEMLCLFSTFYALFIFWDWVSSSFPMSQLLKHQKIIIIINF